MEMRRSRNRHRIDAFSEQFVKSCKGTAAREVGGTRAMLRQRIDDTNQSDIGQTGQHAGMIAAHDACADHADAKRRLCLGLLTGRGCLGNHVIEPPNPESGTRTHPRGAAASLARHLKCGD